jgi:hypothetical protein
MTARTKKAALALEHDDRPVAVDAYPPVDGPTAPLPGAFTDPSPHVLGHAVPSTFMSSPQREAKRDDAALCRVAGRVGRLPAREAVGRGQRVVDARW